MNALRRWWDRCRWQHARPDQPRLGNPEQTPGTDWMLLATCESIYRRRNKKRTP